MNSQAKPAITSLLIIFSVAFVLFRMGQFVVLGNSSESGSLISGKFFPSKKIQFGSGHFISEEGAIQFKYPTEWQVSISQNQDEFNRYGEVNKAWTLTDANNLSLVNVIQMDKQNSIMSDERISCEYFPVGCSQITLGTSSHLQLNLPTPDGFSKFVFIKTDQYVYILHFTENATDQIYQEIINSLTVK